MVGLFRANQWVRRSVITGLFVAAATFVAVPADAQHRARISADLTDHLAAGSQAINVIVHGDRASIDALAARYNVRVTKRLTSGAVLRVNAGQLDALRQDADVDHLSGDIPIKSIADVTAESIGADQVWAGSDEVPGLTGAGVVVAVIDSGIDTRHNAFLRQRVIATQDFTGGDGLDRFGHGTHVASIIAGQPGATPDTRAYQGIASGALLLNLRVLGDDGSGVASDVVEAIDWTIEHRKEFDVRVINLSLGAPVLQPFRDDPLCEAVERAVRAGITVVAAAGNYGRTADGRSVYGGIAAPGNSPYAITVGAVDTHGTATRSDDTIAPYSSKGPTRYDLVIKPDLVAPGSHIVAAESADSYLAKTYPERHVAGTGTNAYMQLSGTSMAAAVVSGAVAVLLEERGNLKPIEIKQTLQVTSTHIAAAGILEAGTGNVNLLAATELIETASLNDVPITQVAGEDAHPSWLIIRLPQRGQHVAGSIVDVHGNSIVWGINPASVSLQFPLVALKAIVRGDAIVWGTSSDAGAIVWGTSSDTSAIVWGTSSDLNAIVWGSSEQSSSIAWGTSVDADPLVLVGVPSADW